MKGNCRGVRVIDVLFNHDMKINDEVIRVIKLKDYSCSEGRFAINAKGNAGGGTLKVTMQVSVDGVNYFDPTNPTLLSNVGTTEQHANVIPFDPIFVSHIRLSIKETGSGDLDNVNVTFIMQ